MDEKTRDNVAENEIERMEDLGQALEESYAHMGNGEYDTDTLLAWEKINEYKEAGTILPVTISGIVNKGVIALVEGVRGFIPVSRLDINHVEDTLDWLGRDIRVRVIEADMNVICLRIEIRLCQSGDICIISVLRGRDKSCVEIFLSFLIRFL